MNEQRTKAPVFLGVPTHDGRMDFRVARSIYETSTQHHPLVTVIQQGSLLAKNCNDLYCHALNNRSKFGLRWFVMLHSDIVPEKFWLDKLIAEADKHGADMINAIAPFKDDSGLTSTALSNPKKDHTALARLTLMQVLHANFPETFDAIACKKALDNLEPAELRINLPDGIRQSSMLLVNTGCMAVRIDKPWSDTLSFQMRDGIVKDAEGMYATTIFPEDWFFSRSVSQAGGKVMATRVVQLAHVGSFHYKNNMPWGQMADANSLNQNLKNV